MTSSQNLANKITIFFDKYNMLGGATIQEMYEAVWKALEYHDKKEIQIIKDYFRDIRWANENAQNIYREIDLYYS